MYGICGEIKMRKLWRIPGEGGTFPLTGLDFSLVIYTSMSGIFKVLMVVSMKMTAF
jgi:hypothetical protein